MSTAIQTSHLLPLSSSYKLNLNSQNTNIKNSNNKNDLISGNEFLSIYIENNQSPVELQLPRQQRFNHRLFQASNKNPFEEDDSSSDGVLPIEVMFTSASSNTKLPLAYMFRQTQNKGFNRNDEISDDSSEVFDESDEDSKHMLEGDFEFEKIVSKSSNKKLENSNSRVDDSDNSESSNNPIIAPYDPQSQTHQQAIESFRNQRQQQHDLLFASHSATVTLSGPSGPFKAIICHDCDRKNQDGQTIPHSVSFSAIKNWNVGNSKKQNDESDQSSDDGSSHDDQGDSGDQSDDNKDSKEPDPDTGFDNDGWAKRLKTPKIVSNFPDIPKLFSEPMKTHPIEQQQNFHHENINKYSTEAPKPYQPPEPPKLFTQEPPKVFNNDANQNIQPKPTIENKPQNNPHIPQSAQPQPISPPHWRYLPTTMMTDPSKVQGNTNVPPQRKPIFTDLIKVPYDALNAPLDEYPQPKQKQPIQIHHQQVFDHNVTSNYQHFQQFIPKPISPPMMNQNLNTHHYQTTAQPEQNYEVDEAVSVLTNGKAHGIQTTTSTTPIPPSTSTIRPYDISSSLIPNTDGSEQPQLNDPNQQQQNHDSKFGYVVEGRNYRKYRVEEKTPDGFIVGEYGVVNNNDGSPLRGVRYTADSNINPRLIYDALLKFLSL